MMSGSDPTPANEGMRTGRTLRGSDALPNGYYPSPFHQVEACTVGPKHSVTIAPLANVLAGYRA